MSADHSRMDRREFLRGAAAGIGVAAAAGSQLKAVEEKTAAATAPATKVDEQALIWRNKSPGMEYARLGRTNYMVSRITQGFAGDESLWRRMLARGINYWDTGSNYGEGNHERALKPFLARFGDKVWITSKASDIAGYAKIDDGVRKLYLQAMKSYLSDSDYGRLEQRYSDAKKGNSDHQELLRFHEAAVVRQKATGDKPDLRPAGKRMAEMYLQQLDESLQRMGVGHVDSYYMHGIEMPWFWDCTEVWDAYLKAHKAGKVKHFGFSVHKHHKPVLAAAVEAIKKGPWQVDLCMPGVNPKSYEDLKEEIVALKQADVGIIAMKTTGIKNRPVDGREEKLKKLVEGKDYNEWERAKLWMLHLADGNIDAVIAATKDTSQMERNIGLATVKLSAEAKRELQALVRLEMAGACHLCGACETNCPEHIAIADMIRYHAYVKQYDEREMARQLYKLAGYDPAHLCSGCGQCSDACGSRVPVQEILVQLSRMMA